MSTNTNVVLVEQRDTTSVGALPVLILCGICAVIIAYFWQIVIIAGLSLVAFVAWLLFRDQQLRSRELSMRADEQNRMYLAGDERGVFGEQGHQR